MLKKIVLATSLTLVLVNHAAGQDLRISESVNMRFSGSLTAESWYFPRSAPRPDVRDRLQQLAGQLDLTFQFEPPVELRINQRFQYDPDNGDRNRYEIEDLYLDYFGRKFEARAGFQIFSWKTVESISQADFLNQTDLESDLLDADKFSELALRLRFIPGSFDQVFELYYFAHMRPTRLPVGKNRYAFGIPVSNDIHAHRYQSEPGAWRPQFALSFQRPFFGQVDTRLFYFNGYNRFPGIVPVAPNGSQFVQEYRPVHKAGLTFQGEIAAWLLKGELVYTAYQKPLVNQLAQQVQPKYFAYTLGFEYTFYSAFIRNHDIGAILEVIGDTDSGKQPAAIEGFRPFRNHLFAGMRYVFNNIGDRSILLGGLVDYRTGDVLFSLEYEERLFEVFTVEFTYTDLAVETAPLDQFSHTDRLQLQITYHF